ncbi:MAG TPA: hypothetical protein VM940_13520 [Chthoniobacterales bacterium]|jgi:hypothetical protein|nr:hypothetical protein [Chthoniobacterales bacterium]
MKLAILFVIGVATLRVTLAQEPPLPSATATPEPSPPARPELNIPDIPVTVEPTPLVPNTAAPPKKNVPSITELDAAFQQAPVIRAVEEQRLQVEWRKLKNRCAGDPDVVAAKKAIKTAKTELEKRNQMRAYYKLYYGRMQALAATPEMKAFLERKKTEIINGLAQPRVRPSATPEHE